MLSDAAGRPFRHWAGLRPRRTPTALATRFQRRPDAAPAHHYPVASIADRAGYAFQRPDDLLLLLASKAEGDLFWQRAGRRICARETTAEDSSST